MKYNISYSRGNNKLIGYCDADWANSLNYRKSVTGYVFIYHGGPKSWKQPTVALSTAKAEYNHKNRTKHIDIRHHFVRDFR